MVLTPTERVEPTGDSTRSLTATGFATAVAVDDFGTGHSSPYYLRRLQPEELKVDTSFVSQLRTDEDSAVIVRPTIGLGHGPGLSAVAEEVEDAVTYPALTTLGCDRIPDRQVARPTAGVALTTWTDAAAVAEQVRS